MNTLGWIAPDVAGGWDLSNRMNRTAFRALRDRVDAFLHTEADQRKKSALRRISSSAVLCGGVGRTPRLARCLFIALSMVA